MAKRFAKKVVIKEPTCKEATGKAADGSAFVLKHNKKSKRFDLRKDGEFFGSGFWNACMYDAKMQGIVWDETPKLEHVIKTH